MKILLAALEELQETVENWNRNARALANSKDDETVAKYRSRVVWRERFLKKLAEFKSELERFRDLEGG